MILALFYSLLAARERRSRSPISQVRLGLPSTSWPDQLEWNVTAAKIPPTAPGQADPAPAVSYCAILAVLREIVELRTEAALQASPLGAGAEILHLNSPGCRLTDIT